MGEFSFLITDIWVREMDNITVVTVLLFKTEITVHKNSVQLFCYNLSPIQLRALLCFASIRAAIKCWMFLLCEKSVLFSQIEITQSLLNVSCICIESTIINNHSFNPTKIFIPNSQIFFFLLLLFTSFLGAHFTFFSAHQSKHKHSMA